jgi:hypothetical protein
MRNSGRSWISTGVVALAMALGACGTVRRNTVPECPHCGSPPVRLDEHGESHVLARWRPGPQRAGFARIPHDPWGQGVEAALAPRPTHAH